MGLSLTLLFLSTQFTHDLTDYHALSYSGSDVVDWLYSHVEGFQDRREARKYACNLLKVLFFVSTQFTGSCQGIIILKTIFKLGGNEELRNMILL